MHGQNLAAICDAWALRAIRSPSQPHSVQALTMQCPCQHLSLQALQQQKKGYTAQPNALLALFAHPVGFVAVWR